MARARGRVDVEALARLVTDEVGRAEEALVDARRPLAARIHDLRTTLKKARALLRLATPPGQKRRRRASRRLRAVAHAASAARDAEVAVATFDAVVDASASAATGSVVETRDELARRAHALARAFGRGRVRRALRAELRRSRRDISGGRGRTSMGALRDGLVDGYRRARRALREARRDARAEETVHAWRRRIKTHRHQLAAMALLPRAALEARLDELDHLGLLLGREHDLAALEPIVGAANTLCEPDRRRLRGMIARRRARLRERAFILGERVFAETPRAFARRVRQ
jgi:hypothetical protein